MGCGSGVKDDKFSDLNNAAYTGNVAKVKEQQKIELKGKNSNHTTRSVGGMTPAHHAAQGGNPAALKQILASGGDASSINLETGETPLHLACFHRHVDVVRILLEKQEVKNNINVQDTTYGMTPLHIAIKKGDPNIVQLLVTAGADPYATDKMNRTVMSVAEECDEQAQAGMSPLQADYPACLRLIMQTTSR